MAKHKHGSHNAIGAKIRKLKGEGKSQKQAVGQALGMARQGSLGRGAKLAAGPKGGRASGLGARRSRRKGVARKRAKAKRRAHPLNPAGRIRELRKSVKPIAS